MWKRKTNTSRLNCSSVAARLTAAISKLRDLCCRRMNERTVHWDQRSKSTFLVVTCLLFGGSSIFLICQAITAARQSITLPQPIVLPKMILPSKEHPPAHTITPGMFRQFYQSLDRLRQSTSGRKKLDSLMAKRPGLLDSIKLFERRLKSF